MELIGARAVVTLPERLTPESVGRIAVSVEAAFASPARVVSLTGAAEGPFCLGLALDSPRENDVAAAAFADLLLALRRAPKPLLAIVDGPAIGGGLGLVSACDWVIATDRSTFALPELVWGLVPAIIWPVVSDRMAPHAARQWTISAHTRTAHDAAAAGLIDDVVAHPSLPAAIARSGRMLGRLDTTALIRFRDIVALGHESGLHEPGFRGPYPSRNRQIREPAMDSTKRHERFADHAYKVTPFAAQYNEVHGHFGG